MLSVIPCEASSPAKTVGDALGSVLDRVEKPDGWAISERYTTGLAGYKVWAQALDKGIANRDGQSYLNQVWLECREMAVEFLIEARAKLPWTADDAFDRAIDHYSAVRDHLLALRNLLPNREKQDWSTLFSSAEGAELVRKAAQAERQGVESLREIVEQLRSNEQ